VLGHEATTASDAQGRFTLRLPPGKYSLLIDGPNLVPHQRVDEVGIAAGRPTELGMVEVWPEERPLNCGATAVRSGEAEGVVASAPETPSLDLPGSDVAPLVPLPNQIWVRGGPGAGQASFGLKGDPARHDEDALGPPSFAIGGGGSLYVADVLNGRIQRFDSRGKWSASFALARPPGAAVVPSEAVECDLALADDGAIFIYAGDGHTLSQYDPGGRLLVSAALTPSFKGVDYLFANRGRPVVLLENGQAARAELSWGGLRSEGPLPGLPVGDLFAQAERADRWRAVVKLLTADGLVRRRVQLRSRVPVTGVRLVGVDRRGAIVVAVDRAVGADPAPRAEVLLLAVTPQGQLIGATSVPPGDRRYVFREFALAADGQVVQMQSDVAEVRFVRWNLPAPPKQTLVGEGLVRGRVVEGTQPCTSAAVNIVRLKRSVPVAPDGSFEIRLPAGTYVVSFRRGSGPQAEPAVERKVAVAAGATVDLGTVSVMPVPVAPRTASDAQAR
jgi:hypothetical protein